jgi:hypothetical protein
MRGILEFNLPEEEPEFKLAQNGVFYSIILNDLSNHLRAKLKYEQLTEKEYEIYESIRTKLYELASEYGVEV